MSDEPLKCKQCGAEIEVPANHGNEDCLSMQLAAANSEISRLKTQVDFWKEGWWEQRKATGRMAWEVPHPLYLKSATNSPFFQQQYKKFIEYAKLLDKNEDVE